MSPNGWGTGLGFGGTAWLDVASCLGKGTGPSPPLSPAAATFSFWLGRVPGGSGADRGLSDATALSAWARLALEVLGTVPPEAGPRGVWGRKRRRGVSVETPGRTMGKPSQTKVKRPVVGCKYVEGTKMGGRGRGVGLGWCYKPTVARLRGVSSIKCPS